MKPLKLTVEPIPVTSTGKSLSRLLPKSRWDKVRKKIYAEHEHRCAICGADPKQAPTKMYSRHAPQLTDPGFVETYGGRIEELGKEPPMRKPSKVRLECHEQWEYNEATRVQKMSALIALCTRCHQVKHWNWAATKLEPPSWLLKMAASGKGKMSREARQRYANMREDERRPRKGGPWRNVWDDEQKFALLRAYNPHRYFLEDHFMWVNDCDLNTLKEHVEEAAEICFRRSQHEWAVDFQEFAPMLHVAG